MRNIFTLTLGFLYLSSFSQPTVGLKKMDSTSYEAYSLFAPFASTETYLVNNCGHMVNSWKSDYRPGAIAYLKDNGNLLRTAHVDNMTFDVAGGNGGRIEEFDWNGNLVWYMDLSTDSFSQHHDIELLPNGNILVLIWKSVSRAQALAAGRDPMTCLDGTWQECIWEIKPNSGSGGTVVWSWNAMDHLIQNFNSNAKNYGSPIDYPERLDFNCKQINHDLDWLHFNSIDYNEDLDQILISCHTFDEIYIIDHSTTKAQAGGHIGGNHNSGGDLIYRYGNPTAYGAGSSSEHVSFKQHDAQWIPSGYPNAGKIVFFNNGGSRAYSSIDMITPSKSLDGSYRLEGQIPFGPTSPDWTYTAPNKPDFFSVNMSGVQPLPNGNFFITESTKGHLFEINTSKEVIWSYVNPIAAFGPLKQGAKPAGNAVFRGYKYGTNTDAFKDKKIEDGLPLELEPLPIFCDDTTKTIPTDTSGNNNSSIRFVSSENIVVYPNPTDNVLHISGATEIASIKLHSMGGQALWNVTPKSSQISIPIEELAAGVYLITIVMDSGEINHSRIYKN